MNQEWKKKTPRVIYHPQTVVILPVFFKIEQDK